jgi:CheY-like chemotaxis protein
MDCIEDHAKKGNMAKGNILIVDDNPNNLRILVGMLTERGYKVRPAPNGDLALKSVRSTLPDLILLDIKMPDMDGYEVCRRLKKDELAREVPVIFISALNETIDKVKAFGTGGVDYITKPFQIEEVMVRIATHMAMRNMQKRLADQNARLRREVIERKRAEEALEIAHAELEKRVEERTAELAEATRKLREEIAERKQAEKERTTMERLYHRAQKLEAMGALAGGIAHDFNNIIGVIMGCAELSLLAVSKEDPIYPHLEQIPNAVRRASDLVQQILTFSRQKDSEKKVLQISTIIKEVLKMLRASLPATIEIKQNINPESGKVLADATQIHQVLINLCTNAAHAMRKNGGVLEIMLANVDLTFDDVKKYVDIKPGAYVKLTVSDTGTGMDPNIIECIFDPYFTTKKEGEGTGLGLAVVHGIISQYGGAIEVQSEPGKGTAFHILIPRIDHEHKMTLKKEFGEPPKGTETILFIDDEKYLVELAKKILEYLGYQVVSSTSSIEALKLFMEGPDRFDLVITDMTMPHMTGDKLTEEILRIRPDIPIILCTGFSEMISEDKAKSLGIREYILKPLIMNNLAEKVRKVLDHRIDE